MLAYQRVSPKYIKIHVHVSCQEIDDKHVKVLGHPISDHPILLQGIQWHNQTSAERQILVAVQEGRHQPAVVAQNNLEK
jgi:hypothetical protein